jgi:nicotinamide mononucleotide transporter
MIEWIEQNYIELFAAVSGFIYLILEIRGKLWLWPFGILTSAVYILVFYRSGIYADMILQVYYVVVSIYGWIHWIKGGKSEDKPKLPISRITKSLTIKLAVISVMLWLALWYILKTFTNSEIPVLDSFTTAFSFVATWMLARKIIEQWWVWVVVNAVSLGLYIYKGLLPTTILFVFYTSMAVIGYYEWRKEYKKQK